MVKTLNVMVRIFKKMVKRICIMVISEYKMVKTMNI